MSDATTEPEPRVASHEPDLAVLTQRVRQLEEAVFVLKDTQALEERIVQRLAQRGAAANPAPPNSVSEPAAPALATLAAPAMAAYGLATTRPPWLLFDLAGEIKNMTAMLLDMHFRLAWTTRIVAILILLVILTGDYWLFPLNAIPLAMKIVNLILAFFLYKILSWETRRYVAARRR